MRGADGFDLLAGRLELLPSLVERYLRIFERVRVRCGHSLCLQHFACLLQRRVRSLQCTTSLTKHDAKRTTCRALSFDILRQLIPGRPALDPLLLQPSALALAILEGHADLRGSRPLSLESHAGLVERRPLSFEGRARLFEHAAERAVRVTLLFEGGDSLFPRRSAFGASRPFDIEGFLRDSSNGRDLGLDIELRLRTCPLRRRLRFVRCRSAQIQHQTFERLAFIRVIECGLEGRKAHLEGGAQRLYLSLGGAGGVVKRLRGCRCDWLHRRG